MNSLEQYYDTIKDEEQLHKCESILHWIQTKFPELELKIAWNQPMFTHHGTFIIGFSVAKLHMAIAPETKAIQQFASQIKDSGYTHGTNIFRIKWMDEIDYRLLENIIKYNIEDKLQCTSFWRI